MPSTPRYGVIADNITRNIKSPCMTCTERTAGCHGKCEGYKNYKTLLETEKTKAHSAYINSVKVDDYEIKLRVKKAQRRKR